MKHSNVFLWIQAILLTTALCWSVGCQLLVPELSLADSDDSNPGNDTSTDTDADSDTGEDTATDSDSDTEPPLTEREQCIADGGYWYDETDVLAETIDDFDALVPTCHEIATENCAGHNTVRYAYRDNGEFLEADFSTATIYETGYEQENLITRVFSTLRCIPNLTSINMRYNLVEEVDLNANERLTYIDFYNNDVLRELYIPRISYVTELHLNNNALTELDLSTAQSLDLLYLGYNDLIDIDVSNSPALTYLYIPENSIVTEIDLSPNNSLREIYVYGNPISSLIMPENPMFLQSIGVSSTLLTELDLSGCIQLQELNVSETQIDDLDLADAGGSVESLTAELTRITTLDLTHNISLRIVSLSGNSLSQVTFPANSPLYELNLSYGTLSYAGDSAPINLNVLTQLRDLNLSANTYLNLSDVAEHLPSTFWETPGSILHIEQAKWLDYADRPANWVYVTDSSYAQYQ